MPFTCPIHRNSLHATALLIIVALSGATHATQAAKADYVESSSFHVTELRLRNNLLIPQAVVDTYLHAYRNQTVAPQVLIELSQQLTLYLVEQGYVNSGVILPDQKVENGIVYLELIPGRLESVEVNGQQRLRQGYIHDRLRLPQVPAFNVNDVATSLRLLQQDPRIEKLDAAVRPGTRSGDAILQLSVEEAKNYEFSFSSDNHLSQNVGDSQQWLHFSHINLSGYGDSLMLSLARAEGLAQSRIVYQLPVTASDSRLQINYEKNATEVVAKPFDMLEIEGESTRAGVQLTVPLYQSLASTLKVGVGLERYQVKSYLLGEPYNFSGSGDSGENRASILSFSQDWLRRSSDRVFAFKSDLGIGLDLLDATVGTEPDGRFATWDAQAHWLEQMQFLDGTFSTRARLRIANDTLPQYQKFALGGMGTVRGYRQNLFTRDNGAAFSLAYQIPLAIELGLSARPIFADSRLSIAPFVDYGYGWDDENGFSENQALLSAGVTIEWRIGQIMELNLSLAQALSDTPDQPLERGLQDDGIQFDFNLRL